jgi:hypothetical protein
MLDNPRLRQGARTLLRATRLRSPLLVSLRHLGLRAQDAFIASYPRSGNTWLRFLLCEILIGRSPDFGAADETIPYIGGHRSAPTVLRSGGRLIKTHERYHPVYRKAIYLVRDPRDVVSSDYRYAQMKGFFASDLDSFVERFVAGRVHGFGSWPDHVSSWLDGELAGTGDLMMVRFEDLRSDPEATLQQALDFLGVPQPGRDVLQVAVKHNALAHMQQKEEAVAEKRARPDLRIVHQGSVGGWRDELRPNQVERIEAHTGDWLVRLGYA